MSSGHVLAGLMGAVSIVLGAVWAAWPVALHDADGVAIIAFPYVVHGAVLGLVGLAFALWGMNGIRRDKGKDLGPPAWSR